GNVTTVLLAQRQMAEIPYGNRRLPVLQLPGIQIGGQILGSPLIGGERFACAPLGSVRLDSKPSVAPGQPKTSAARDGSGQQDASGARGVEKIGSLPAERSERRQIYVVEVKVEPERTAPRARGAKAGDRQVVGNTGSGGAT
ncbi:unnamed protein product, partial [Amoebophrya sp. A25]